MSGIVPITPANIAASLPEFADAAPYAMAVACPGGRDASGRTLYAHLTRRGLLDEVNALARGLETMGIGRGTRVALMVRPSLEFFGLTFALFRLGAVPVLIDPGMGVAPLGRCLAEAKPEAFLGVPKAQAARVMLGWGRDSIRAVVTVGRAGPWGGVGLDEVRRRGKKRSGEPAHLAPTAASETAAILFTSGSTGPPKGAIYTHGIFLAQVAILRELHGIEPGEVDLATFPLFALFAPALGMTAIVPEMDPTRPALVDPTRIIAAVNDFGVTNLFGSPALLDRVGRYGAANGIKLPSLRRVLSAGAPARAAILERFAAMLAPGVQIYTPYGATEALPVASIGSDAFLAERAAIDAGGGVPLGRPVGPVEVAIIGVTDDPIPAWSDAMALPPGTVGEIVVKGPVVTRRYLDRPEADARAKIADGPAVRHRMGDLGRIDAEGRLWFHGRKAHRVTTALGPLDTIPVEAVFNAHPEVRRTALVGVGPAGSMKPVLCVELEPEHLKADRDRVRRELLALGAGRPHTAPIREILFHPGFPVDIRHNAKIFREKLAVWAARRVKP